VVGSLNALSATRSVPSAGIRQKPTNSRPPAQVSKGQSCVSEIVPELATKTRQQVVKRGYFAGLAGCTGVGPAGVSLIGDSGGVGVTSAPASFAALKVVPGGVGGGRLSMIR
jgi:hypothetical protein